MAPLTGGGNLNFLENKPVTYASSAFPNGMNTFPIFTVAIIRLKAPVKAPVKGPTVTASSRAGSADRWNSTTVPGADGSLIEKKPNTFPKALMTEISAKTFVELFATYISLLYKPVEYKL